MNKKTQFVSAALIILVLQGNTFPSQAPPVSIPAVSIQKATPLVVTYTWFYDEWLVDPSGGVSDIPTELARLRNLYSGYIFSSTPGMGLHQFEYGYYPGQPLSIIYSNLP